MTTEDEMDREMALAALEELEDVLGMSIEDMKKLSWEEQKALMVSKGIVFHTFENGKRESYDGSKPH